MAQAGSQTGHGTPPTYQWWTNVPFAAMIGFVLLWLLDKPLGLSIPQTWAMATTFGAAAAWVIHAIIVDVTHHQAPDETQLAKLAGYLEGILTKVEGSKPATVALSDVMQLLHIVHGSPAATTSTEVPSSTAAADGRSVETTPAGA